MRTALCTIALAALVACGDSNSPKSINGVYPLRTVDGDTPPTVIYSEPDYSVSITEGSILINGNGTFTDTYKFEENDAGVVTSIPVSCSGTWTRSGNTISLEETQTSICGDFATASWDGNNTLTVPWELLAFTAVHRR